MANNLLTGTINWDAYKPVAIPQKFNVNTVSDVPTLNKALRGGQISTQQWNQRFQQLQKPAPKINTGFAAAPGVINEQDLQPLKKKLVGAVSQAKAQALHLAGPTSTQAQRNSIINNQAALQRVANPQLNTENGAQSGWSQLNPVNIGHRLNNDIASIGQHLNPNSGLRKANNLIGQMQTEYGLTPAFVRTLHNANTSLTSSNLGKDVGGETDLPGTDKGQLNRINVNPKVSTTTKYPVPGAGDTASNLLHEGLHQVYLNNPKIQKQFLTAFSSGATSQLKQYIDSKLENAQTPGYKGVKDLDNLSKATPDVQNEAHSYIAQYLAETNKLPQNNSLTKYYGQFFNPTKVSASAANQIKQVANIPKSVNLDNISLSQDGKKFAYTDNTTGKQYPIKGNVTLPKSGPGGVPGLLSSAHPTGFSPIGKAARAIVRPVTDIATGKGGKAVHDVAQLSRDTGSPANYLLNASIVNPTKELAASVSGNKVAAKNANIKSNENLGLGDKGTRLGHALLKLGVNGTVAGLGAVSPGLATGGAKKGVEAIRGLKNAKAVSGAIETQTPVKTLGEALQRLNLKQPPRSALDNHLLPEGTTKSSNNIALQEADNGTKTITDKDFNLSGQNLPEVKPPTEIPKAGKFKNLISVSGELSRQGDSGKEIADRLGKAESTSEIGQAKFLKQIPTVTSLKGKNFKGFVDTLDLLSKNEGKPEEQTILKNLDPTVRKAVDEYSAAIPTVRKQAESNGVDVGDLGKYYFPKNYSEQLSTTKGLNQAAQHLVNTGQAKDLGDAIGQLKFAKNEYSKPFGHFEKTRKVDLPEYDKSRNSLVNYIGGAYNRIGHAEQFGPKGEIANKLIGNIGAEGHDSDRALRNYQIATGTFQYHNPAVDKALQKVRGFNRVTKLGLSSILNATQSTNTAAVTGVVRTTKAALKQLSPAERAYVEDTGVRVDSVINALREQTGAKSKLGESSNFIKKVLGKTLNAPGFGAVEKLNRGIAATAGRDYAQDLAKSGSTRSLKVLRDKLGVEGDIGKKLTPEQEVQASRKIVELTQFKTGAKDLPGWADSPAGKTVAQFRTFSYKQTGFVYNQLVKEAMRGNVLPLARFVAVGVPVGLAAGGARNVAGGKPFYGDTKGQSDLKKFLGATFTGSSNVGGTGLAGTGLFLAQNRKSPNIASYVAGDVGGPTVGLGASTIQAGNDKTKLKRLGLGQVPVAGPYLKNRVTPYGSAQQRSFDKQADEQVAKTLVQSGYSPTDPSDARSKTLKTSNPKQYQQVLDKSNKLFAQKVTNYTNSSNYKKDSLDTRKKTLSQALSEARQKTLDSMNVKKPAKKKTTKIKSY